MAKSLRELSHAEIDSEMAMHEGKTSRKPAHA